MSRGRAVAYSLCGPLLYFAVQSAVTMAASLIYITPKLELPMDSRDLQYEMLRLMMEMMAEYSGHIMIVSGVLLVCLFLFAYRKRSPGLWEAVRLTRGADAGSVALAALAGVTLGVGTNAMLSGLPLSQETLAAYEEYSNQILSGNIAVVLIAVVVFVPFIEELVFRGFTQRYLARVIKPWQAVTLQAVVFAMFHGNSLQIAFVLPSGFLMGAVYLWTRSLWAPIAVHTAFNLSGFLLNGALIAALGENAGKPSEWLFAGLTAAGLTLAVYFAQCVRKRSMAIAPAPAAPEQDSEQS